MHVVYVPNEPPETYSKSLFLAGPSPRDSFHPNWRPEALKLLEGMGYDGVVFVPLAEDGGWCQDKEVQYAWEKKYLDAADQIVFWVPRNMGTLPGLTTNVEFGMYYDSGRVVLGYPSDAPHMNYLHHHARKEATYTNCSLLHVLDFALNEIDDGAARTGGERDIPLNIWRTGHFQSWYQAQVGAGNRIDGARVLWTFRAGPDKSYLFAYAMRVNVYVASEGRNKTGEFIISRPDVSAIVAYYTPKKLETIADLLDAQIAIVREFRSSASLGDCMIREVPSGSSWKPGEDPSETAAHELSEETGLSVATDRLRLVGARQVAGTLSTHRAHVFACALTLAELEVLKTTATSGQVFGVSNSSERTYVEVRTVRELLDNPLTDWANAGMVVAALNSERMAYSNLGDDFRRTVVSVPGAAIQAIAIEPPARLARALRADLDEWPDW